MTSRDNFLSLILLFGAENGGDRSNIAEFGKILGSVVLPKSWPILPHG
jgi:hypothetical protein